ncbi:MAG: cobalamin biosynthesis protein CbiD [Planctomycetes bacterium]|nr:cobalamin biosynthesis protein CbiD [Planctomycetota bacterium]
MKILRTGYTTGTCAAAAAKAAALVLSGKHAPAEIDVALPDGSSILVPILHAQRTDDGAQAAVRKDAGDDPDITNGAVVVASVAWSDDDDTVLLAGEGVGAITKPGLQVPPGEPAINPVPRQMIRAAVREVTSRPAKITISVPGGEELARRTFNPRLGVVGGLSILGTTGRVRPFSCPALRQSLKCALDVAGASGIDAPVFVPGNTGERAARRHLELAPDQVVLVSNEWGYMLDHVVNYEFAALLALGHPGKLAKLADGQWDTHSSRSESAVPIVSRMARDLLGRSLPESTTTEGLFASLAPEEQRQLGDAVASAVWEAVNERLKGTLDVAIVLVNMKGDVLGARGDLSPWQ